VPVPPFKRMRPGQPLSEAVSASDENRLRGVVEALAGIRSGSGDRVDSRAGVPLVYDDSPPWIMVRIVSGTNPYVFVEARDDGAGTFYDLTEGVSGTAYELTGNTAVPTGTHTWARLADDRLHWLIFFPSPTTGGGSGIEVRQQNLAVDLASISILTFRNADGFSVAAGAVGEAIIGLGTTDPDASLTVRGYVSLTDQTLGAGRKAIADKLGVGIAPGSILANSALDVRGYTYAYFAGVISFGGGNAPADELVGSRLTYNGTDVVLAVGSGAAGAGKVTGTRIESTNKRFVLVHQAATGMKYSFFDGTSYTDGVTGTGGGGDVFLGGICIGLGTALSPGTGIGIAGSVISNTGVTSIIAGSGISVSSATGAVTVSLTVPVTIARGGTNSGAALNNSRIMVSSGGAIVEAAALTNGQLLIGSTGAAPAAGTITAGAGITITNAAGAITVAATAPSMTNARLTADAGTALLTATDITGLSFSVLSGEVWSFEVFIRNNKSSLTAGIKYAINAPAASTLEAQIQGTTSATTAVQHERMSGLTTLTTAAFNTVANADGFVRIAGVVVAGANGTVQIQHAAVTSQTATARANSYITARKIA
jgi:hypothetical protein